MTDDIRSRLRNWERFDQYVSPCPMSGCWLWTGAASGDGYGTVTVQRKQYACHRRQYERYYGAIPPGMVVCHHCDVPLCVNPAHLFLGTVNDNTQDMVRKGRHLKGERHWKAKATEQTVSAIRNQYAGKRGDITNLAREFGMSLGQIRNIVRRRAWKHV